MTTSASTCVASNGSRRFILLSPLISGAVFVVRITYSFTDLALLTKRRFTYSGSNCHLTLLSKVHPALKFSLAVRPAVLYVIVIAYVARSRTPCYLLLDCTVGTSTHALSKAMVPRAVQREQVVSSEQ